MRVVVPFDTREPKTRLSSVLDSEQRRAFAQVMRQDVCRAVEATGHEPTILANGECDCRLPVRVDDRPLSEAVNAVIAEAEEAVAVVMADLALATPETLERVFEGDGDVVLVPGRGGGTNVVLARHPEFRVDYHGASITDHREHAAALGVDAVVVDSFRLATDVDEPDDLVEVLLHGQGAARSWLDAQGFTLDTDEGRVTVRHG